MDETFYKFVIDTNSYSGNFERELCGYVTGHWDNETHGGEQAKIFDEEVGDDNIFEDDIKYQMLDHDGCGYSAPQEIVHTPEKYGVEHLYSSVAICFERKPTEEQINLMKERSYKFEKEGMIFGRPVGLKILGFRLITKVIEETEEEISLGV